MQKYSADKKLAVMSRDEVRAVDSWAINEIGAPGVVLMENAGRSCAELIMEKSKAPERPRVCIFCGTGNNGGDGYVIARHLLNSGFEVVVVICGDRAKIKGDAGINLEILEKLGHPIEKIAPGGDDVPDRVADLAEGADMIVDALFGTGLAGEPRGGYSQLIETINHQNRPILAVDIPSGLDCDTGRPLGTAIRATYTVTFVAVKKGFASEASAAQYTGEVYIASIGIEPADKTSD